MVNQSAELDAAFAALADGTRREIVARLARSEATISELAEPFAMSLPAVSKHLKVLERAGLIERRRDGRAWRCRLVSMPLDDVVAWVQEQTRFWSNQLDAMERYIERSQPEDRPKQD